MGVAVQSDSVISNNTHCSTSTSTYRSHNVSITLSFTRAFVHSKTHTLERHLYCLLPSYTDACIGPPQIWLTYAMSAPYGGAVSLPLLYLSSFRDICVEIPWVKFRPVQGQQRSKVMVSIQSKAHWLLPVRLPLTPASYLSPFSNYSMSNFNDFKLGGFKVVRGQSSRCQ